MGNWWSYEEIDDNEEINIKKIEEIQNKIIDDRTNCDIKFDYIEELKNNVHFKRRRKSE